MGRKIVTATAGWLKHKLIEQKSYYKNTCFVSAVALVLAIFPFLSFLMYPSQAMEDQANDPPLSMGSSINRPLCLSLEDLYSQLYTKQEKIETSLKGAIRAHQLLKYIHDLNNPDLTLGGILFIKEELIKPGLLGSGSYDADKLLAEEEKEDMLKKQILESGELLEKEIDKKVYQITCLYAGSALASCKKDEIGQDGQFLLMTSCKLTSLKEKKDKLYDHCEALRALLFDKALKNEIPYGNQEFLRARLIGRQEEIEELRKEKLKIEGVLSILKHIESLDIPQFSVKKVFSIMNILLEDDDFVA